MEACLGAEPDLVILPAKQKDVADTLAKMGIPAILVLSESHQRLEEMITLLGKATNTAAAAEKLISYYNTTLEKVVAITKDLTAEEKPVVYMAGSSSYLNTAPKEMYQASLIEAAGGINAGSEIDGNYWVEISYEQILAMNPAVIVIPTNNIATGTPDCTAEDVLADASLSTMKAVTDGAVYQMTTGYEA